MTTLDVSEAKACCKRHELKKYRRLGLSVEEVVEVSMKLNALRSLGIHLNIEGVCVCVCLCVCVCVCVCVRERERERIYSLDGASLQ